jgi:hypothetical protein
MKLWYKINLPLERLTKYGFHLATHPKNKPGINYTIITRPDLVLSPNLLDAFVSLNVHPWFVVFNTHPHLIIQNVSKEFIHKDLTGLGGTNWQAINGALSFEVNPTTKSVFRWFDTADYPEKPPVIIQENNPFEVALHNGIHYSQRGLVGVQPGMTVIEETILDKPIIVRTDVPHSVTYDTTTGLRCGISIRFKESTKCWEEFSNCFAALMDK